MPNSAFSRRTALRGLLALPAAALLPMAASATATAAPTGSGSGALATGSRTGSGSTADDLASHVAPDWMRALPDAASLAALSIPGTHDTMAYDATIVSLTQTSDLPTQLEAGIRAIDIRTRHFRDSFSIHHGPEYLHANFTDVVRQATDFLRASPSETILMRMQSEFTEAENTRTYEDTLNWYIHENPDTKDLLAAHLWTPPPSYDGHIPTLGETRGRLVILQEFSSSSPFGPRWQGAHMDMQDAYELSGLDQIPSKWAKVEAHFEAAVIGPASTMFVNHISATFSSDYIPIAKDTLPVTVAKGAPGVVGMLARTEDYLGLNGIGRTGVVMADFPTARLVRSILARNG